jgi:hypothetical protein
MNKQEYNELNLIISCIALLVSPNLNPKPNLNPNSKPNLSPNPKPLILKNGKMLKKHT